ncbi:transposase [Thermosulfidibacter takaii]|uniref:transposase n=1 Tax=Thermosulfidibacter takaii TaxID=412593 RepID=UPI0009FAD089|nr:transposase [Thermosulfidibacter takaii]
MAKKRKYTPEFKARVAIEALKEETSINEIASKYGIHPQMVRTWKREFSSVLFIVSG